MTEAPKRRGRKPAAKNDGTLTVKKADTIHDGEGGFLAVGDEFEPADEEAGESLKAKGYAE